MAKEIGQEKAVEPTELNEPRVADELVETGWRHYSKNEFDQAEEDFRKSLELTPHNADTMYAMAMSQQAAGRAEDAIQTFEKVIQLLETYKEEDPVRALMLTRLANGHINRIKTGEWKLTR